MRSGTVRKQLGEIKPNDLFWHRGKEWIVLIHINQEDRVDWEFLEEDEGVSSQVEFSATFVSCISGPKEIWFIMPQEAIVETESPYIF
jgi:hypothetical protein